MATKSEWAAFAYDAYRQSSANAIQVEGWSRHQALSRPKRGAGFDGSVFLKVNEFARAEIVISFRGTDSPGFVDYPFGNIPAAAGYDWGQIYKAIELVADTMNEYPGVPISFTGHSLGGGLASLMATFFNVPAYTFDTAPFELSATDAAL